MNNTLAIDMINLDHTYLCYNGEIFDNNKRRRGNIRPAFYDNRIDIDDNTFRELITYHTNQTQYCYESLLAIYILRNILQKLNQSSIQFIQLYLQYHITLTKIYLIVQ